MPIGEKPNIQDIYINGKEWDGKVGEFETSEIETDPVVQLETPASIELTLPLTPVVYNYLRFINEHLTEALKAIGLQLNKYLEKIKQQLVRNDNLIDRLLYEANDNPRWWHLYKHAKKARTRKKYKHLLVKQLHKLRSSER